MMINTVLGEINAKDLGITLMHEHISWDWDGESSTNTYNVDEVVDTMLPFLLDLKKYGCSTFVDATTKGAGRDIDVLKRCAEKSGLNIITNVGGWDGSDTPGKYLPERIKNGSIEEIVNSWCYEFYSGIDGTDIKPGFVKIAIGDTGEITELQERLLRAAARTSLRTNLPVQCHTFSPGSALRMIDIIEEERLPYDKFIWVHADAGMDFNAIKKLAQRGAWVEFDCLARIPDYSSYVGLIKMALEAGFEDRMLMSQDAGTFYYGEKNDESTIFPYSRIFKEFIPLCVEQGIPRELFDKVLIENPAKILNI